jgi:hypothetical protein
MITFEHNLRKLLIREYRAQCESRRLVNEAYFGRSPALGVEEASPPCKTKTTCTPMQRYEITESELCAALASAQVEGDRVFVFLPLKAGR